VRRDASRIGLIVAGVLMVFALAYAASGDSSKGGGESAVAAPEDTDDTVSDGVASDPTTAGTDQPADSATSDGTDPVSEAVSEDSTSPPTLPDPATTIEAVKGKVFLLGGSSLAGLQWNTVTQEAFQGFEYTFDAESCRRLYVTSCAALRDRPPTTSTQAVIAEGAGHYTMVHMGGYNDSGAGFRQGFTKVVEAARAVGIKQIVWLNYRTPPDYEPPENLDSVNNYKANNAILADLLASGEYADVVVADWNKYSLNEDHWFVDNVHLSDFGSWGVADYISRKVAFLDGRACPQPRKKGDEPQNPCPDPDLKPPDVDFSSLYSVRAGRLTCTEVRTEPAHIDCKPPSSSAKVVETLRFGMRNAQVRTLQEKMIGLKLMEGEPSGYYGEETVIAVMRYQEFHDLPPTGTAGPRTREELGFGCPDKKNPESGCPDDNAKVVFVPSIESGHYGVRTLVVETRLKELGYLDKTPSMRFGATTVAAVKAFQKDKGLKATGVVDAKTAKKLGFSTTS
jgi:hypothetical protein